MRRIFSTATIVTMMLVMSAMPALAEIGASKGPDTLARALGGAWLPLESGLAISAHEGTPLSAKYEIDDGTFQLSVYVMKPGAFAEVIVDHDAGTVAKVIAITDGGDLAAVPTQTDRDGGRATLARDGDHPRGGRKQGLPSCQRHAGPA